MPEKTKLILNGDDLITSTLAPQCKERFYFGLDAEKPEVSEKPFLSDIVYCPECGSLLESEYLRYNHIGRMYCPSCKLRSPERDYTVTDIDRENGRFTISIKGKEHTFNLINDNIVNVYNFAGAIALLTEIGLTTEQIEKGFSESEIVKTRFDQVTSGDLTITMQLSKGQNPTACARCFSYVSKCPGDNKAIIFVGDNFEDSESPCWFFDSNYSYLKDPSISQIIFSGPRCKDQFLRAQIAGVPTEKVKTIADSKGGCDILDTSASKDIYVLYGPYMVKEANIVKNKLIQMGTEGK